MLESTILIAVQYPLARLGLRSLLEHQTHWKVVGEAVDGRGAVRQSERLRPNLVILDVVMPRLNGLDAAILIRQASSQTRLLVLGRSDDGEVARRILDGSIDGFILHSDSEAQLLHAIKSVLRGEVYFGGQSKKVRDQIRIHSLTAREEQVLQLLAEGLSRKQTAGALHLSVRTVENHCARMTRKLEMHSLADLIRYGIRHRIIQA